jgi:hypothetical protein
VCAYGINTLAPGANSQLGSCRTVTVPTGSPVGHLDFAVTAYGVIRAVGWVIDPDTAAATQVHIYVNGVGRSFTADASRPDVGSAYPGAGNAHGFDVAVSRQGSGANTVCAYGIDTVAPGNNVLLGCGTA